MILKYFNGNVRQQIQRRAQQFGLKGQEAIDVLLTTKNTVKEVLYGELKNGHYSEVLTLLKSAAVEKGSRLFFDKIIQRVVGRLILRFGLPQTVAFTLATLLVPFILKKLGRKALKSGKVQDLFRVIGVTDRLEKFRILKHQVADKFSPPDKVADKFSTADQAAA
ncbi:MAG: hypothetical protein ACO1NZ_17565 [Adhaeribacter sp.]